MRRKKSQILMTKLGEYLSSRSINKSSVSRKTGINRNRINELTNNPATHLHASELYLIAKAIKADSCELLEYVCGDLKLRDED